MHTYAYCTHMHMRATNIFSHFPSFSLNFSYFPIRNLESCLPSSAWARASWARAPVWWRRHGWPTPRRRPPTPIPPADTGKGKDSEIGVIWQRQMGELHVSRFPITKQVHSSLRWSVGWLVRWSLMLSSCNGVILSLCCPVDRPCFLSFFYFF